MSTPQFPGLPSPLAWQVAPSAWTQPHPDALTITAPAATDLFIDPDGTTSIANSPRLVFPVTGPAVLQAEVEVDFQDTFDAGVLLAYQTPTSWAKLCFERSPAGEPWVVSVVTRGRSDDANHYPVTDARVWLRVALLRRAMAFHASSDGRRWDLMRLFALADEPTFLGFSSQAPHGERCEATFRNIAFRAELLADVRSGA